MMRRVVLGFLWTFGVMVVINMAADVRRGSFPAALPGLVAILAIPAIPTLNGYFAARQWERLHPVGQRRIEMTFDDAGIRASSLPGAVEIRWEAVQQVVETSEFLIFYWTAQVAHYLPKRAVPASDLPALRDVVRSKIASGRVHLLGEATRSV